MAYSGAGPVIGTTLAAPQEFAMPGPLTEISSLPAGFPEHVSSALAWTGSQFADQSEYVYTLSQSDVGEIEMALKKFKGALPLASACNLQLCGPTKGPTTGSARRL